MAKFMLIYRDKAENRTPLSPEEMQGFLGMWDAWLKQFGERIVESGDELLPTGRVLRGSGEVANGPYVEAKDQRRRPSALPGRASDRVLRADRESLPKPPCPD